jgi:DNA-binding LytR/AlgR family response regulator
MTNEFNILIVDDFEGHRITAKRFLQRLPFINRIYTAADASEMIEVVMNHQDINTLIIDFDLGEDSLNGIQAYTILQESGYDIPAILVTGHDIDAFESYTVGIVDVISKRFFYDFKRLNQAMQRLGRYHFVQELCDNDCMYVTVYDGKIQQFLPSEVLYIESASAKTAVYTTVRDEPFMSDFTQKSYEEYLENSKFERLSRFLLVNTDHIESFEEDKDLITLSNGTMLNISSSNRKYVRKLLGARKSPASGLLSLAMWGMKKVKASETKLMTR